MPSSYQVLMEGKCEISLENPKNKEISINLCELLRDLYDKCAILNKQINIIATKIDELHPVEPKEETMEEIQ